MQNSFLSGRRIRMLLLLIPAAACILLFWRLIAAALGVIFGACLICFLLNPICMLLEKKLKRQAAAIISVILAVGVLLAAFGLLAPVLLRQFGDLAVKLPDSIGRITAGIESLLLRLKSAFPSLPLPNGELQSALSGLDAGRLTSVARGAISTIGGLAGGVYRLALSVILSCYFLIDREKLLLRLELLLPLRWRKGGVRLGRMLLRELRLYLRGQATISLAVGLLAALGLTLLGVEGGALLGGFVGACNIIPYVGPFIGGLPAVLVALGSGWQKAAFTIGLLFLVQQADGLLLSPRIMGNITGFSPAAVLLTLYLAGNAGGIWGLLLAMPLLMTARTLYRVLVQSRLPESPLPVQGAE